MCGPVAGLLRCGPMFVSTSYCLTVYERFLHSSSVADKSGLA